MSLLLQLGVPHTPLHEYFGTVPLAVGDWFVVGLVFLVTVPVSLVVAAAARRL